MDIEGEKKQKKGGSAGEWAEVRKAGREGEEREGKRPSTSVHT